jgi:hypothetical protein
MNSIEKHARYPNWSECASCGEWFTSDSAFDAHLGSIPKSGRPKCKAPASVRRRNGKARLVFNDAKGAWQWDDPVGREALLRHVGKGHPSGDRAA